MEQCIHTCVALIKANNKYFMFKTKFKKTNLPMKQFLMFQTLNCNLQFSKIFENKQGYRKQHV